MDARQLCETRWDWLANLILETWPDLAMADLDAVKEDYHGVVTLISDRCGYGWHEAAERLDEVVRGS